MSVLNVNLQTEVCPVDCFYEGENMLVINPEECIDCGVANLNVLLMQLKQIMMIVLKKKKMVIAK